ncbi:hypothetical protein C2857_005272 [Epichloe festucae Fl1]|uniref:RWD domain-containing protein n=1 Tax=Epichloe festucae (strain Fl1) TaxID=877507 RepID=A0A7S9KPQ9_EPIFF|nr:hypothetical protein C2857_005272 [Epichloe festucae Fl1]
MSDELRDEIEVINSIYGDGSLTPAEDEDEDDDRDEPSSSPTYVLKLPVGASSLRIQFPAGYPQTAPVVLGAHHSSGGVRGAGARDAALFRSVVGEVFRKGEVCLFDGVEEFSRRGGVEEERGGGGGGDGDKEEDGKEEEEVVTPAWTISEVVVENKSTFVARVARVRSPEEARHHVGHLLATDRKVRGATHNVTAWRTRGGTTNGGTTNGAQFQDFDDDGETAAGGRLLRLMQVMDVWGVVVVVSRWYGGVRLGPRRFAVINGVARDGLVRAGVVEERRRRRKVI